MTFTAGRGAIGVLRAAWSIILLLPAGALVVLCRCAAAWRMGWLLLVAVWGAGMWYYLPRLCRSLQGVFGKQAVHFCVGVWWKREVFVPLDALRNFEVWAPPLHRLFHCRTVVLRFAGGSAWLPLLGETVVHDLTAFLKESES